MPRRSRERGPLHLEALQPAHIEQLRDGRLARRLVALIRRRRRRRRVSRIRPGPGPGREGRDVLFELGNDDALGGHLALARDALVREEAAGRRDMLLHCLVAGKPVVSQPRR